MPRGNQLIRQWRLLRAVEASRLGRTAAELHDEVSELGSLRTVYPESEALASASFPLAEDEIRPDPAVNGHCVRPFEVALAPQPERSSGVCRG